MGVYTLLLLHVNIPIIVSNAHREPTIGDIANEFVDAGAVLDIPVAAQDADGNPLTITVLGLPTFASYVQTGSDAACSAITGLFRFAPGNDAQRGDYSITVVAQDNGDGGGRLAHGCALLFGAGQAQRPQCRASEAAGMRIARRSVGAVLTALLLQPRPACHASTATGARQASSGELIRFALHRSGVPCTAHWRPRRCDVLA